MQWLCIHILQYVIHKLTESLLQQSLLFSPSEWYYKIHARSFIITQLYDVATVL